MAAVLLVAADEARRTLLQRALPEHSVLTATSDAEAVRLARYVDVDVVLRDAPESARGVRELAASLRQSSPASLLLVVGLAGDDVEPEATLPTDAGPRDVDAAVTRALDKQRLLRELATLRARGTAPPVVSPPVDTGWDGVALARALKTLARAFAVGFDLPRALDTFLDAVSELLRPARLAVLLPDSADTTYRIVAHRGLAEPIVASVHVSAAGRLAQWLRLEGRPARLADLDADVARELTLLHCVVAVPLLAHGELVGVLVLGPPVVRPGYADHEIETLFDLSTHVATTVRDISLHHRLAREKEFSERILAHLSAGVITIGRDHRVGTMNRRAEEILGRDARGVVGEDLRTLPSPLGDMLYETLVTGQGRPQAEIQLALGARDLEVSTYPVRGDDPAPLGAVLVFEDLTSQKQHAAQRRAAEQRELLTRVVARIADEIKNPLVSVNTFVELLEDRVDDPDFRKDFAVIVRRDVRRIVQVFEKLTGLVSDGELHFSVVDAASVVDDVVTEIQNADEHSGPIVHIEIARDSVPRLIRVDVVHFRRALTYLVWFLAQAAAADPARVAISIGRATEQDGSERVRLLVSSRTATVPPEKLVRLFDPVQMVQEGLLDVGPAVSQRLVEALGGQLRLRQGRHDLAFLITLPVPA